MSEIVLLGILGLGSAAAYALLSTGLVLIYRASGVLNFAQGAFAMVAAFLFFELRVNHHVAYIPAMLATVLVMSAVGAIVYLLILQRLREASVVVKIIATIGIMVVLEAIATLKYAANVEFVPESLPSAPIHMLGVTFARDVLYLMGIAIVLTVVFTLISSRTRFGILTRAVAENERASAAYGHSPRWVATANWAIGTGLAALAGVLIAPVNSVSADSLTLLVVPALAVALFGGFKSFPLTLLGAIIVGVLQGISTKWEASLPGLADIVPLALVIIVMLVRRRALPGRGELIQRFPSLGTANVRGTTFLALFILSVLAAFVLPLSWSIALGVSVTAAIVLVSMVVITGYAGQLSLAQYAMAGIGALVAAQFDVGLHWPFWSSIIVGVLAAGIVGYAFGVPALRSRGATLAIITLSLGTAVTSVIFNNPKYAGGGNGFVVNHLSFFGININPVSHPRSYTVFSIVGLALAVWVVRNLRRSDIGRRLISIRANERASASLGINVGAVKLYAFAVASMIAALGGILIAFSSTSILLSQGYDSVASTTAVTQSVIGGIGFIRGAVIGGTIVPGGIPGGLIANQLGGSSGADWLSLVGGVLLLVTVVLNPNGVAANLKLPIPAFMRPQPKTVKNPIIDELAQIGHEHDRKEPGTLELKQLSVNFGGVKALSQVDLSVKTGQITALIGPNGAGKTTLIDGVTGYVTTSGEIIARGQHIEKMIPHKRATLGVTRSFQSLELFDDITVEENLRVAADSGGPLSYIRAVFPARRKPLSSTAMLAIREFGIADDLDKRPKDLSYGRRKLVAIARAVAAGSDFLLLDEPAAGLGEEETRELGRLVRALADDWNIGVLLIEHDVNLIMSISDRVAVLDYGVKIADGSPDEIRTNPKVIAAYLGEDHDADANDPAAVSQRGRQDDGTGAASHVVVARAPSVGPASLAGREVISAAVGASFGYNDMPVVHDLDLKIHKGQVVALLGPNGAGKTTTVLGLAGELRPLAGDVSFIGSAEYISLNRKAQRGLGYLAEERSVFMQMTVAENFRVAGVSPRQAFEYFPELERLVKRRVGLLSGGEQQMLALSAVLARDPSLILADELSLGLAPLIVDRLLQAVRHAADTHETGVLLVEQHVSKALQYADYVYVLRRGQIVLSGTAEEMRDRADELSAAYLAQDGTGAVVGTDDLVPGRV